MKCPSYERLLETRENPDLDTEIRDHVAACERCAARLRLIDSLASTLAGTFEGGEIPPVPDALLDAASGVAAQRSTADPDDPEGRDRHVCRPTEAPRETELTLRGPGALKAHRVFRAGPYEIEITKLSRAVIVGNVQMPDGGPPDLEDALCILFWDEGIVQVPLEENGDFHFEGVHGGRYSLLIESASSDLLLPDFDWDDWGADSD